MRKQITASSECVRRAPWRTVLPLACLRCGYACEVSLPGRLLRVKGKTYLVGHNGAICRLTRLVCPACGAVGLYRYDRL